MELPPDFQQLHETIIVPFARVPWKQTFPCVYGKNLSRVLFLSVPSNGTEYITSILALLHISTTYLLPMNIE